MSTEPDLTNIALILAVAVSSSIISEGLCWYFYYRHADYKKAVKNINDTQDSLDQMKEK